jgi:maltooligosyltrehalose trehalohydrolase
MHFRLFNWHIILITSLKTLIYTHLPVGAHLNGNQQCSFTVWAPLASSVSVVVSSETSSQLHKGEMGYWSTTVTNLTPGTKYWYKLNNESLRPDPASRCQPDGVHGPSAIVDFQFNWTDHDWHGIELTDLIIYELHTGTFTPEGNFQGIISKLNYLQELGITAIELMPVAQFPGTCNWGYDGVFPFAIHNTYGSTNDLKQLVNEAHQHSIAVILDVVYNHAGPEGNYLHDFGPYFTDKYKTPWGNSFNFDGAWCDGVRNFFIYNALMWLDEFHIDGLRLDAVHAIYDFSARHILDEMTEQVRLLEKQTGTKKLLIAELDLNNPRYITPVEQGGYGMDAQWVDEFHHALHVMLTGETSGYYEDFGGLDLLARSLENSYVYTGQFSPHRKRRFGVMPENRPYNQFIAFVQNHDQVGNRLLGDRLTTTLSAEALKLAAATLLLSPHVPLLFMGEEYGEKNPFLFFTSYTDEALINILCEARRSEFAAFNWQGEVPDPQSYEIFRQSMLSWKTDEVPGLLSFYRHLIELRKTRPAMKYYQRADAVQKITVHNNILQFERHGNDDALIIYLHFGKTPVTLLYEQPYTGKIVIDSSDELWGGPGSQLPCCLQQGQSISLNPLSAAVFERTSQ